METVKVSPKFQVVIPKRVREELQLRPGLRVECLYPGRDDSLQQAALDPRAARDV